MKTHIQCQWFMSSPIIADRCTAQANTLIIYGCSAMHISEISFCWRHRNDWVIGQNHKPKTCGWCHCKILDYIPVNTQNIKDHYQPLSSNRYS